MDKKKPCLAKCISALYVAILTASFNVLWCISDRIDYTYHYHIVQNNPSVFKDDFEFKITAPEAKRNHQLGEGI